MTSPLFEFHNNFKQRLMEISFPNPIRFAEPAVLYQLRTAWIDNLRHWESPYNCLVDCRNIEEVDTQQRDCLQRLVEQMRDMFMKRVVGWVDDFSQISDETRAALPFEVLEGYGDSLDRLGIRHPCLCCSPRAELRSRILIENDFEQQSIELSFVGAVDFSQVEDFAVLQAKLETNLYLWHTGYAVLINCENFRIAPELHDSFAQLEYFLRGFFCRGIMGYGGGSRLRLPFPACRTREDALRALRIFAPRDAATTDCSLLVSAGAGRPIVL